MSDPRNRVDIHVGSRIRDRRVEVGISVDRLAEATGMTPQEIQAYESGAGRIGPGALLDIGDVLQVSPSYFFSDVPERPSQKMGDLLFGRGLSPSREDETAAVEAAEILAAFNRIKLSPHRRRTLHLLTSIERLLREIGNGVC